MPTLSHARRPLAAACIALFAVFGMVSTAQAASTSVVYDVQASAVGQSGDFTVNAQVAASAPATAAPGATIVISLSVGSISVPTSADGYTVTQLQGLSLKIPVPAHSTYVSAKLSGGSNYGKGKPTVSEKSGVVTIKIPGPIAAGTTFTLPTMALSVKAGTSGTIVSSLSGTSYTKPGMAFTAVLSVSGLTVDATAAGYPATKPSLTTTTIS